MTNDPPVLIVLADDDPDDRLLTTDALRESGFRHELVCVNDGEELLQLLRGEPPFAESKSPDLILLDLNMPRKNGREALAEIKESAELRSIPVIALTTSQSSEDVVGLYDLGASSFIVKPVRFDGLVDVMRSLGDYWFDLVRLPRQRRTS